MQERKGRRVNVLLIDDHELIWNGTRRLIERLAGEIDAAPALVFEAARDVATACLLPAQGFDLVLLDYHLPGLSGVAALGAVKAHFESTPVCILSAETLPERVREVLDAGAAGFIPKSYALDEMEAAVRVVLRRIGISNGLVACPQGRDPPGWTAGAGLEWLGTGAWAVALARFGRHLTFRLALVRPRSQG